MSNIGSLLLFNKLSKINLNGYLMSYAKTTLKTPQCFFCTLKSNDHMKRIKNNEKQIVNQQMVDWIPIYRFPYIVPCRILSRTKLYITIFTTTVLPIGYVINADIFQTSDIMILCGLSSFSLVLLYGFGYMFRRLIGSIYVSSDKNLVRISHMTFFGNRAEKIVPYEDVLFLSEINPNMNHIFLRVSHMEEDLKNSLFICLKYGGILDEKKFVDVFGPL